MAMVPKFLISLLDTVQKMNLSDYPSIQKIIGEKIDKQQIDFSEFNIQQPTLVTNSTSAVTKSKTQS